MDISHRAVDTNGISMHIAEAGSGPLVLLCHGFPESWYSWRHQLEALADAGYHAVAPDMRGYGKTDQPHDIDQYTLLHIVGDLVGAVSALGYNQAAVVGHDWGATVAWHAALLRPDIFKVIAALGVPPAKHRAADQRDAANRDRDLLPALFPGARRGRARI
jgi:pimeloyl-ACP methyl ester carboxylesterase